MREFTYFLFENFDAAIEASNPSNPRNFLGKETDPILSMIAQGDVHYKDVCSLFGKKLVAKLINGGILRCDESLLVFDCPIFLKEDANLLNCEVKRRANGLVERLQKSVPAIRSCCKQINNGFPIETNLYHILCGMVFDGTFFDYLSEHRAVATGRPHPSGLDYLSVIYENCDQLNQFSNGLLCSYNRLVNGACSLQSFGDADGKRLDFYRLFRIMEHGSIPVKFRAAAELAECMDKDFILSETLALIKTGKCDGTVLQLLALLGYCKDGKLCVPVFYPEHRTSIEAIETIVEDYLGNALSDVLINLASSIDITAVKHGINRLEIANELYHILFGCINEELVQREIVGMPKYHPGEGRYLKCIEIF